jgi:hypothetical protein
MVHVYKDKAKGQLKEAKENLILRVPWGIAATIANTSQQGLPGRRRINRCQQPGELLYIIRHSHLHFGYRLH